MSKFIKQDNKVQTTQSHVKSFWVMFNWSRPRCFKPTSLKFDLRWISNSLVISAILLIYLCMCINPYMFLCPVSILLWHQDLTAVVWECIRYMMCDVKMWMYAYAFECNPLYFGDFFKFLIMRKCMVVLVCKVHTLTAELCFIRIKNIF